MGRPPAKKGAKPGQFQPSPDTRRIVPMQGGEWFDFHTPDGKRLKRHRSELALLIYTHDADDRTPGWFTRAATDLGLDDVLAEVAEIKETNQ